MAAALQPHSGVVLKDSVRGRSGQSISGAPGCSPGVEGETALLEYVDHEQK